MSPYDEPAAGLEAIASLWEAERDGPDEPLRMTAEVVAVEGNTGVARVKVSYDAGDTGVPRPVARAIRRRRALRGLRGVGVLAGAPLHLGPLISRSASSSSGGWPRAT